MSKVPKLRFPEFKGEWEEKELGELGGIITGKTPSTKEEGLWDGDILFVTPTDMSENKYQHSTERTVKKTDKMNVLPEKTVMVTCIASIGKMSLSTKPSITNQQINSIVPYKEITDNEFLYYAILKDIDKIKASQSSSTVPIINKTEFGKINTFIPSIEEQQKIADCLLSLDELIEARKEKITSLKAYKKGLLQQLFPQEMCNNYPPHPLIFSKLPKLRFAGFEGEWEEVKLGDVVEIIKGEQKNKLSLSNTGKYYVMNGGIAPSGYTNSYNTDKDTISISEGGNSCGYIQYNKEKFWSGGHCYTLHIHDNYKNKIDNFYLYQYLKAKEGYIMGLRVGSGLPNIQKITLQNVIVYFPSLTEQQKIADCLLSLDEKIAAETEQVAQLQQHKKGLLQQLLV